MTGTLTSSAALLLGLVASGHCIVMCGGISGALGLATSKDPSGAPRRTLLVAYQLGRIASYTLIGMVVGSIGDRVISVLDVDSVRTGLRFATGLALAMTALALLSRVKAPGLGLGRWLWPRIARLGRRLVPITSRPRAFAFGMLWGWMPCGLAYSVLLIAALAASPLESAAIMLAFGLGTLPAMLASGWSAPALTQLWSRTHVRKGAGVGLLMCAFAVMAGPWLLAHMPALHAWLPFDCFASD